MAKGLKARIPLESVGETKDGKQAYILVGQLDSESTMLIEQQGYRRKPRVELCDGRVLEIAYVRWY